MAQQATASYRALFRVRGFGRVVTATGLARFGGQMWEIVLVLFVLARYHSPELAGLSVLVSTVPGLVLSPLAGALLDRQGRVRLMIVDHGLTAVLLSTLAGLSLMHRLPPPLLLAILAVLSISNILSITGARSLFPLMLPANLWDRANGLDTSLYSLVAVGGPAVAGVVVAKFGPEPGLMLTAAAAATAAIWLIGVGEPVERVSSEQSLIKDAWAGLFYVLRHRSLRGLAITLFFMNLGAGVLPVGIPVLVLRQLHGSAATVGEVFAVFGLAGLLAGLAVGRLDTAERERTLILAGVCAQLPVLIGLAFSPSLPVVFLLAAVGGASAAAANVGIFALRQRRTDPAWFGRAFAVSLSMNFSGVPIGSALSGPLLAQSTTLAMLVAAGIGALALPAAFLIPPRREGPVGAPDR
jgi:MFS family permease